MSLSHIYAALSRSQLTIEQLHQTGRIPYEEMNHETRRSLTGGQPGDLKFMLDSALQEPPVVSTIIAISAVCERAVYHTGATERDCYAAQFLKVGKQADRFLARQQG